MVYFIMQFVHYYHVVLLCTLFCICECQLNGTMETFSMRYLDKIPPSIVFSTTCFTPSPYAWIQNCTSVSGNYPSNHVICKCKLCPSFDYHLRCHVDKAWYPQIPRKCDPANLKAYPECRHCNKSATIPANVVAIDNDRQGDIGDTKIFRCKANCVDVPLVCGANKSWVFEKDYYDVSTCSNKSFYYNFMNRKLNIQMISTQRYRYTCNIGYYIHGRNSLKCIDGILNGELPRCIRDEHADVNQFNDVFGNPMEIRTGEMGTDSTLLTIVITMSTLFLLSILILAIFTAIWCKRNNKCPCFGEGAYINSSDVQNKPIPLPSTSHLQAEYFDPLYTHLYDEINTTVLQNPDEKNKNSSGIEANLDSKMYDDIGPNLPPVPVE